MRNRHFTSVLATLAFVILAFGSADPPPDSRTGVAAPTPAQGDAATPAPEPSSEPAGPPTGGWTIEKAVDPMTDDAVVTATLEGKGEPSLFSGPPTIKVRCMKAATDVLYDFHDGIVTKWNGADFVGSAEFRYDDDKPKSVSFYNSEGISTTYFSRKPQADAKDFMAHKKLLVGYVAALGGKTVYTNFDLTGSGEALKPIREACKW
jgi:hypothetical protein